MIHTLTHYLHIINRDRQHLENQIQKRKAIGYVIKILLVIAIGALCWYFRPIPFLDKGEPGSLTTQGDR